MQNLQLVWGIDEPLQENWGGCLRNRRHFFRSPGNCLKTSWIWRRGKMSNRRVLHVCLYIVWQIQEFADYADISVDEAVDYVVPILKGMY